MAKKAFVFDGTNWIDIAQSTADLSNYANMTTTPISGFRNAIINGDFKVWQRGTSFSSPANGTFVSDRWVAFFNGTGTRTFSQQAHTLGTAPVSGYESQYFLRCNQSVAGTGGTFNEYNQKIESVRTFAGQTVSVSFWAKAASTTVLPSIVLRQEFGTGGSPSASVNTTVASSISVGTTWTRFTYTTTLPSLSGKTIGTSGTDNLTFILALPLNATFTVDIWGVQLEEGSIATPFEQRPIGTELALCQRYYEKSFNTSQTPADGIYTNHYMTFVPYNDMWVHAVPFIPFRVEKRGTPTITFYGNAGKWQRHNSDSSYTTLAVTGTGFQSMSSISTTGFGAGCHNNGASGFGVGSVVGFRGDWVASAEL